MPGVKSGRGGYRLEGRGSYRCSFCVGKMERAKSIIGYVAADPKGALPVFEGDRRYTSDVRADNIASVDTDCAETKTVPNRIDRCKGSGFVYQSLYEVAGFCIHPGRSIFQCKEKSSEKSLRNWKKADPNWMYDDDAHYMFYKGCDIRDGEQMYRLYGQCRKK